MNRAPRIAVVDTGVNPWHSHVGGSVSGCRIFSGADGRIAEDGDFRDLVGHGTAVAGIIREGLPDAHIVALRVFDAEHLTYPSLVARAILRAAVEGCTFINLSLGVPPGPGVHAIRSACAAALDAGCVLVASTRPGRAGWLPAAAAGVHVASADDSLEPGVVRVSRLQLGASGHPRDLAHIPREANLWGHSFACARALVHLATRRAPERMKDTRRHG